MASEYDMFLPSGALSAERAILLPYVVCLFIHGHL